MSLLRARLRQSCGILIVCTAGCVDDLDLAGYPGAKCYQPQPSDDLTIETSVAQNYVDEHGHRVVEGDIIALGSNASTDRDKSNVSASAHSWLFGLVPYTVDSTLPEVPRRALELAFTEFESHTNIRFVMRSAANESLYPNYVRVVLAESEHFAGRSSVGMIGGEQLLDLTKAANLQTTLHELGHAVGLLHEQQRHDRDQYVTIHEEHIDPENLDWYLNLDPDAMDVGSYDFDSVMHYSLYNAQGQSEIEPKIALSSPCWIGAFQRLSAGDQAALSMLYPSLNLGKHGDLNGDGTRDHIWRGPGGAITRLLPEGRRVTSWSGASPGDTLAWYLTGTGDFGGDGVDDLLWALPDGSLRVFDTAKAALDPAALVGSMHTPKQGFQVVAIDDFDGDGDDELLMMHEWGRLALVSPQTNQEIELQSSPFAWRVAATGDLDGDAKADIVWRPSSDQTAVWFMSGAEVITKTDPASHESGWWIAGIDDFDGDGRNDIVWTSVLGGVALWWNDGGPIGIANKKRLYTAPSFAIAGTGDFDGDGVADLRWANDEGAVGLDIFSTNRDSFPRMIDVPEARLPGARLVY